jgi:hypothetical protein
MPRSADDAGEVCVVRTIKPEIRVTRLFCMPNVACRSALLAFRVARVIRGYRQARERSNSHEQSVTR